MSAVGTMGLAVPAVHRPSVTRTVCLLPISGCFAAKRGPFWRPITQQSCFDQNAADAILSDSSPLFSGTFRHAAVVGESGKKEARETFDP